MKELIIAFGLFLFIEGILYAIFPSKMKSMLKKLELVNDSQLRTGEQMLLFSSMFDGTTLGQKLRIARQRKEVPVPPVHPCKHHTPQLMSFYCSYYVN